MCLLASSVTAWLVWQTPVITQDAPPADDLSSLFTVGGLIEDRNGDGDGDGVAATFVLGESAGADDVAAAAEVAARVAFETSALTLPLRREPGASVVVIGQAGLARLNLDVRPLELPRLAAGEGLVRVATLEGIRYVLVLGGDGAGLRAAARTLAGRLPYVWSLGGATYAKVERDVEELLSTAKVSGASVAAPEFHVKAGTDGIERVVVVVRLSSIRDMTAAMFALQRVQMDRDRSTLQARALALSYPGVRTVSVRLGGPDSPSVNIDVPRANSGTSTPAAVPAAPAAAKDRLDLSSLFTPDGLLADSDGDLIPDGVDAGLSPSGEGLDRTIDLAARLGLESTGVVIPLMRSAEPEKPGDETALVIIGETHPLLDRLVESQKLVRPTLGPGEGLVQVVRNAFGDRPAVIVTGGDASGVDRALAQFAERLPHIWDRGTDRTTLDEVEDDVSQFVAGHTPAGQAALALDRIAHIIDRLGDKSLASVEITAALDAPDAKLSGYLERFVRERVKAATVATAVTGLDITHASPIVVNGRPLSQEFTIGSEVDEFWNVFNTKILKTAKRGRPFRLDARLSEPATVRAAIADDVRAQLVKRGLKEADVSISILSAYKQGYSWLVEEIRPALIGKGVTSLVISFADAAANATGPMGAPARPTGRWLAALLPADEVLARDLDLPLSQVVLERMPAGGPTYRVVAKDASGAIVLERTFEAKHVSRPRLDRFPGDDTAHVATGWITATSDQRPIADQRLITDIERFWAEFQSKTLEGLRDYVVALDDGRPRPDGAPLFGTLTVDVALSEPDEVVGIGLERVASLEALQEEIDAGTRRFLERVGDTGPSGRRPLGRIVPIVRPTSDGRPGKAVITATGFAAPRPMVVARYVATDGTAASMALDLPHIAVERASASSLTVKAGEDGLARLDLTLKVDSELDEPDLPRPSTLADRLETAPLSAAQVDAVFTHLGAMRASGVYASALAYQNLGELRVRAAWTYDDETAHQRVVTLAANGTPGPSPSLAEASSPAGATPAPLRVPLDTPLSPTDAAVLIARMAGDFREATAYSIGRSLLGREIWAVDLTAPIAATHFSRAKATTFKPTVVYSGRERGSESASTSHLLKLAELLLTEPQHRAKLDKVNVVLHPMANPDGAALAADLWRVTPAYVAHAASVGAMGDDLSEMTWEANPRVPELASKPRLWRLWWPDVMVTGHGQRSRELTPLFSSSLDDEFRRRGGRASVHGWFMPSFSYLDDPQFPRHKAAAFSLRDRVAASVARVAGLDAAFDRARLRVDRANAALDADASPPDVRAAELIATPVRGARSNPNAADVVARYPRVTYWAGGAGAPATGTHGAALAEAAAAGLALDLAVLDWLAEQPRGIERQEQSTTRGVRLRWYRQRPSAGGSTPLSTPSTEAQPH